VIIDGLQINDWSREVMVEVRSGGVDVVHARHKAQHVAQLVGNHASELVLALHVCSSPSQTTTFRPSV
jgi:hypothetical protein